MTPAESLEIFGSTIEAKWYNGNDYTPCTFSYVGTVGINSVFPYASGGDYVKGGVGRTLLKYAVDQSFSPTLNPSYITLDIAPLYSIFDTSQIHSCIALSSAGSVASTYLSPTWEWRIDGAYTNFENSALADDGTHAYFWSSESIRYTFVPMDYVGQSLTSGYSYRATFAGNAPGSSPRYTLLIGCPYVDSLASGSEGTFTTVSTAPSSGGGDINVDVNVDMSETNGLLGQIKSILQGIVDGIKGLFIPSDAVVQDFKDDMEDLLEDHLGGLYEAFDLCMSIWPRFQNVQAKSSIDIPVCNVPLAGETFTLGPYSVPLKVQGMPSILYDSIAWIIDFLAISSFLRMCRTKLEIFLNPDSEVVSNDN